MKSPTHVPCFSQQLTLAVAAITCCTSVGQAQLLYDDFTADSQLNTSLWTYQSSLLDLLNTACSAPTSTLVTPVLSFGPSGMEMSGVTNIYQLAGIQSLSAFAPPFTLNFTVEGVIAAGFPFELFLVNSDLTQWFAIGGNIGANNGVYYGLWVNDTSSGHAVCSRGDALSSGPTTNVWYSFQLAIAADGNGSVAVSTNSTVLAAQSGLPVGTGPFYLILAQREGNPAVPGPNVAVWQSVALTAGVTPPPSGGNIGLTITPAAITNDYVGKIILDITSLTTGMTVAVDAYADLNGNGVIDAGDLLVRSFQVTDGQVPLVAGVRNLNVPGDDDGLTNSQIRVLYNFPETGGSIWKGNTLIRVSDPAGQLSSATGVLSVAERLFPQRLTGRVTAAGAGLPLTNCIVGSMGLPSATHLSLTDTNGTYSFHTLSGVHVVVGMNQQGAVFNQSQIVNVPCGQTVTNNIVVTNGAYFIAGRVTDSSTGAGIPNLQMDANSSSTPSTLAVFGYTDSEGNYALQVTANTWNVHPTTGEPTMRGYVDPTRTKVTVTSASVSNLNFALSPPTALIYGTITDTAHNPIVGIKLDAVDQPASRFHVIGRSFVTNASYSLGVQAGTWNVTPDSYDLASQGYSGSATNITLVAGQATNVNLVVIRTNWPSLQTPVRLSPAEFQFLLNGLAGQNYVIQTTTNPASGDWLLLSSTNAPCDTVLLMAPNATNGQRFYRVGQSP